LNSLSRAAAALAGGLVLLASEPSAHAQTDEIQVYTAEIAAPGELGLTLHDNFTFVGRRTPALAGGVVPQHSLNGVPELELGVTDWLELGLYLPVYTYTGDHRLLFDGLKLRALMASPHAATRQFFYGLNVELSYNRDHWSDTTWSLELRFIVGAHLGPLELALNPILEGGFHGPGSLELVPATRVAYHLDERWAVAVEEYAGLGALDHLEPLSRQAHSLFAVVDLETAVAGLELGLGYGLTKAADRVVVKLLVTPHW
jgi:hypothetical protein